MDKESLLNKYYKAPAQAPVDPKKALLDKYYKAPTETKGYSFLDEVKRPEKYTAKDLTRDEFFKPIQEYMIDRYGAHFANEDREEVVRMYLNNMRGFSGGNSVRSVAEIAFLNEYEEGSPELARAGEAYKIYEGMEGMFSGETSVLEKLDTGWDFARATVADPVNLVGLGVGKTFTSVGFKGGSQVAKMGAKKAATRHLQKLTAQGVAKEVAIPQAAKYGERVLFKANSMAQSKVAREIAKREALQKAAKGSLTKKLALPGVKQEAATFAAIDSSVAAATDYLYQDAMLRTAVQEDYDIYQTGLATLVGLVAGGIGGGLSGMTRGAGTTLDTTKTPTKTTRSGAKISDLSESIGKYLDGLEKQGPSPEIPAIGNWKEAIKDGHELTSQNTQFFITMLLGDDRLGMKGLAQILDEQGYAWKRRDSQDMISNFVGDIIEKADPQDFKSFLKTFKDKTGITVTKIINPETGKEITVDLDQKAFADTFKRKMSDSAKVLNAASQTARVLGKDVKKVTANDYVEYMLTGVIPERPDITKMLADSADGNKIVRDFLEKTIPGVQNNLIRLMVAHPSTTALNITGWSAATALNSATDISRAALLTGKAGLQMLGLKGDAKTTLDVARNLMRNQKVKMRNLLDPNTSYETFLKYSQMRPEAVKELARILPGGVENLKKTDDVFDIDLGKFTYGSNQFVDVVQRFAGVQAQDMWTKSIEFITALDKQLRRSVDDGGFGMSWDEFFNQKDFHKIMRSERYINLEANAVDTTLKSVFSKSYAKTHFIGGMAKVIEDFRNLPGIGLAIPFGRFFNNTIGFMADNTVVIPLLSRALHKTDKPTSEIIARGLVSIGLVGTLMQREYDYIEAGLNWNEEFTPEGAVINEQFEFPYSGFKAMARVFALRSMGKEVPEELGLQLSDQFFAQLTRQLGDSGEALKNLWASVVSDEGEEVIKAMTGVLSSTGANYISAATRFVDPLNQAVGIARGEDYALPDRKQGNQFANDSLRYMDQIIGAVAGDPVPEKAIATQGVARSQATKTFSTYREDKLTNIEILLNQVGLPGWKVAMRSASAKGDNRYNELFFDIVEAKSKQLLEKRTYKNANLEKKRQLLNDEVLKPSRDIVKDYMLYVTSSTEDSSLYTRIDLSKKFGEKKVRLVANELGIDPNLDKMTEDQIGILKIVLESREEWLRQQ